MEKRGIFTKILAIAGTALVLVPILAPVLFSLVLFIKERLFRYNFLMPAELFLYAISGGVLLIIAALRADSRQKLIGLCLIASVGLLFISLVFTASLWLDPGAIESADKPWMVVLASIIGYSLAIDGVGIGGLLLLRDLFKTPSL